MSAKFESVKYVSAKFESVKLRNSFPLSHELSFSVFVYFTFGVSYSLFNLTPLTLTPATMIPNLISFPGPSYFASITLFSRLIHHIK